MTDVFSKKERSRIMAGIRSSNTKPELKVRKALRGKGFAYQPKMKGRPDFFNRRRKIAVFVDGCFWHGCPRCYREPKTNRKYWLQKIKRNTERDKKNTLLLRKEGFRVIRIREHEIRKNLDVAIARVMIA